MKRLNYPLSFGLLILATLLLSSWGRSEEDWGFFGHRRINRMAVFTLPAKLAAFYKQNIEFVTEHAVDPDKRRYATRHEAVRHYIDIDHWGTYPYEEVPRKWTDALIKYTELYIIDNRGDTLMLPYNRLLYWSRDSLSEIEANQLNRYSETQNSSLQKRYQQFFNNHILPNYYEDEWPLPIDSLQALCLRFGDDFGSFQTAFAIDRFSEYGILPYNLLQMQRRLTQAFVRKDIRRILRLSADFGHYVGDAHVPLHTTENYNGQFTDQVGIHAFWESRIPELFADQQFDFFVGPASYIDDPSTYFWDIVLDSHVLLDSVLLIEKRLSETFPSDQQYCYEERLNRNVRTQCRAYAAEYNRQMKGMVEKRMQEAISAVGDVWYTAWVDAGQPNLREAEEYSLSEEERQKREEVDRLYREGDAKGREHN
ncbi:MAG: zinc dependent phospholipase C family protein [Bacteroidota bacterium]